MAGIGKTIVVGTLVVVGLTAASGTPQAQQDAQDTAEFVFGTVVNSVTIGAKGAAHVLGGMNDGGTAPAPGGGEADPTSVVK